MSTAIELRERTFVVAGAGGGGIGTAVCRALVEAGARVVALDADETRLQVAAEISPAVKPHVCDVRDADAVTQACRSANELHGLVHVAGGLRLDQWAPTVDAPLDAFDDVFDLNLRSALVTSQVVARRLIESDTPGGTIVHIASIVASSAMPFGAAYAAAKAGLLSLTRTQAVEWGPLGIRVNAVAAGSVVTPKNAAETSNVDDTSAVIPLGRRGTPDDVAHAVLYLCSELASFVTGHTLMVDGGSSVRPSFLDADGLPVFVTDPALRKRLT